jgi:4,5-dihydroxyphthalate decarboxylase
MNDMSADQAALKVTIDDYPHTLPIKTGEIKSSVPLDFVPIKPINRAFKPMVREQKADVSEMAIVTYLQAKVYGKPIVLLPAIMFARFQHHTMLYNSERGVVRPKDLEGKRLGMRAYTQTTGAWMRGILANEYGVDLNKSQWVTFEDAHVAEFSDPPGVERAAEGKNITKMLLDGELSAAIFGGEMPDDPLLRSVIEDPTGDARAWYQKYGAVPINHMVVVTEELSRTRPDAVREVYRVLLEGKKMAGGPKPGEPDMVPFGVEACRPSLEMIIGYAFQQGLIPRKFTVEELFDDTTRAFK